MKLTKNITQNDDAPQVQVSILTFSPHILYIYERIDATGDTENY